MFSLDQQTADSIGARMVGRVAGFSQANAERFCLLPVLRLIDPEWSTQVYKRKRQMPWPRAAK